MEYSNFIFLGLGAAISVMGFFLKRLKEDVDSVKRKNASLELSLAKATEKLKNLEKLAEDRREDIKKLFEGLSRRTK